MGLNNNITIFTIVPVTRKGETNTTDRKIAVICEILMANTRTQEEGLMNSYMVL